MRQHSHCRLGGATRDFCLKAGQAFKNGITAKCTRNEAVFRSASETGCSQLIGGRLLSANARRIDGQGASGGIGGRQPLTVAM